MGANHPVSFCKDYQGGRSFYTALGNTAASFDASLPTHLKGAINWAAGQSRPGLQRLRRDRAARTTSRSRSAPPPNLNEPIGFDQFPDGRIIQTSRRGDVRLHNPATGTTTQTRQLRRPGPAADAADLHELRGRPLRPGGRQQLRHQQVGVPVLLAADGHRREAVGRLDRHADDADHGRRRTTAASPTAWDPYVGYFQLSRFKFVEDANGPRLDLTTEQQILRSRTTARSAATSRATSTSTSTTTCGWSRATTRRPAASTPAATVRSTTS